MERISENNRFTSEQIKYLSNIRIIQKNIIHVHGFPKSIARTNLLKSNEYFGQYGNIVKTTITYKINPDNNKKLYSAYIVYSNESEAALAVLCVDSLLIYGKIIRVFFGTNKYCNNFLNNKKCPNVHKCLFIHQLASDKDIIINDDLNFSYNDHINLAKKILKSSNIKNLNLIKNMANQKKNKLPSPEFIFLTEEEKENYFSSGNFRYIGNNTINKNNNTIKNNNIIFNNFEENYNFGDKNSSCYSKYSNFSISKSSSRLLDLNIVNNENYETNSITVGNSIEPIELHKIFNNSINHILSAQPFFSKLKNFPLRKMELAFFQKDLAKNNKDINILLDGCLDFLKKI